MVYKFNPSKLFTIAPYLIIVLIGFVQAAMSYAQRLPDQVHIPSPVMPKPNAFDYYVKAGSLIKDRFLIDPIYIAGVQTKTSGNQLGSYAGNHYNYADLAAVVEDNSNALQELSKGLKYEYMNPPVRSAATVLPYYNNFRLMSRLIALKSRLLSHERAYNQAFASDIDGIKFGADIAHGSIMLGAMSSIACQSGCRIYAGSMIDNLSVKTAKQAIQQLEEIDKHEVTAAQIISEEKYLIEANVVETFGGKQWLTVPRYINLTSAGRFQAHSPTEKRSDSTESMYTQLSFETVYSHSAAYMDQMIRNAELPWSRYITTPKPAVPSNMLSHASFPIYQGVKFKQMCNLALNHQLETQLALHVYKLEYGKYPTRLDQLVPAYLNAVPTDPFADDAPLHYKLIGSKYLVYSIGPDGKDDGGKPIVNPGPELSRYGVLKSEAEMGDIVAGVNY